MSQVRLNDKAFELVSNFLDHPTQYRVRAVTSKQGGHIIDAGVVAEGGYEAGRLVTEICLGGYGEATLGIQKYGRVELPTIQVSTDSPVIATLGSQLAGWRITIGEYRAIASGPARALARKPKKLFSKIQHSETAENAIIVLESSELPTEEVLLFIASACGKSVEQLYVIVVPTNSVAGLTQISGRIVETAIHKLMELGFNQNLVRNGLGSAPIAPFSPDIDIAMGRANDMLLYGGVAYLTVDYTPRARNPLELKEIVRQVPSLMSPDYGRPFAEIFASVGRDFYKLDPHLFAPAVIVVSNLASGEVLRAGSLNADILAKSINYTGLN